MYYYLLDFKDNDNDDKRFKYIAECISYLNNYDLYIFLEPDVKWVQDGSRTYGDQKIREKNNKILKKLLDENGINYICVSGDYQNRYQESKNLVKKLLGDYYE